MKLNESQISYLAIQAKKNPSKDGFLYKKSGKKNTLPEHTAVRWQSRWCVVYCNMLFYFENKETLKPQGVIFLEGVYSAQTITPDKTLFCFNIGSPSDEQRQYLFGCLTEKECESWIHTIILSSFSHLTTKNDDLQNEITKVKSDRESLRQEVSDQWSVISRLKTQLSSLRNQYEGNKSKDTVLSRRISTTDSIKADSLKDSSSASSTIESVPKEYTDEDIKKIIKIQSYFKSRLINKRWGGLVKTFIKNFTLEKLQQRNKFLWQFITSEEDFVAQMSILVNIFLLPMKNIAYTKESCISEDEIKKIFINSETILVLHQIFIKGMESRMQKWPAVQIDDLLFAVKTAVPIYIEYIKNHPKSLQMLAECKKRDNFVKMLKFYESKEACHGQTLEQFLYYPIRVIPNYIRNIHSILEVTPTDHVERESLEVILQRLHEAQCFNHYLDEGESIRHTLEIERLIEGGCHELLNPDQKFVRHGVLKQLSLDTRFPSGKREKIRHCFLFSHHLIIGSRTVDGSVRLSKQSGIIPLCSTILQEELEATQLLNYTDRVRSLAFKLTLNSSNGPTIEELSLIFMAAKANEKALWTSDISQCIFNLSLDDSTEDETADISNDDNIQKEVAKDDRPLISNYTIPLKDDARLREDSNDIKYTEEVGGPYNLPTINYASVDRLIERLSDPRLPGAEFMETFLLTYKAFTSSRVVMEGLIEAYWKVMGGKPVPKKEEKQEKNIDRRRYSSTKSNRSRGRSVLSTSSFSSIDDLESSFSSTAYPFTSSTVFNYNTLKEQLNSPTKTKESTTKWCAETNDILATNSNGIIATNKLRSTSACDITNEKAVKKKKYVRSQSAEIILSDKIESANDSEFEKDFSKCRSCDDLDHNYGNHCKPDFIKVSREKVPFVQHMFESTEKSTFTRRGDSNLQFHVEMNDAITEDSQSNHLNNSINQSDPLSESYQSTIVNEDYKHRPSIISYYEVDNHANGKGNRGETNGVISTDLTNDMDVHFTVGERKDSLTVDSMMECKEEKRDDGGFVQDNSSVITESDMDDSYIQRDRDDTMDDTCSETSNVEERSIDVSIGSSLNGGSCSNTPTDSGCASRCDEVSLFDRSDTLDSLEFARNNTYSSANSNASMEVAELLNVPKSQSDEIICKKRSASEIIAQKTGSLDQKKSFISPYFRRKKKDKKEKILKGRSSSDVSDLPILLNVTDRGSNPDLNRSRSELEVSVDIEIFPADSNEKKPLKEVSSYPMVNERVKTTPSPTPPRRKRSLFTGSFPFRLNPLKRTSSEQVLTINDMIRSGEMSSSTNDLNDNKDTISLCSNTISLYGKDQISVYGSMSSINETGSLDQDRMSINEESMKENLPILKKKNEKGLLRRKKTKNAIKLLMPPQKPKEEEKPAKSRQRKVSVIEQGRPNIIPRKSISINRGPLKIMSIFKHWLAKHPKDFVGDPELLNSMETFFDDIKADSRTLPVVREIVSSLVKTIDAHRKSIIQIHPIDELLLQQQALRNVTSDDITELDESIQSKPLHLFPFQQVAENMTMLEHYLYARISFHEFISCQWTKKDKDQRAPGIMKFISRFNKVTNIISYSVVHGESAQVRASIIEFWIRVAAHCRDLNNFNAIMEIISALNASSVHRLKKSWEIVSRPMRHFFTDLEALVSADRSFKNLREAVHRCNPPCVPYLGCYLSDILFVHDGGPTFDANELVNFSKMCRISRLVREIKCYQQLPYTLELNKDVAYALVNFEITVNEDMLYEQSLLNEPRGS